MAIILKTSIIKISDFLTFHNEKDPVQIVDIINDTKNRASNLGDFYNTPGVFVYETDFSVRTKKAIDLNISKISFDFFLSKPNPDSIPIRGTSFSIPIETVEEDHSSYNRSDRNKNSQISTSPSRNREVLIDSNLSTFKNFADQFDKLKISNLREEKTVSNFRDIANYNERDNKIDPAKILSSGNFSQITPLKSISFGIKNSRMEKDEKNFERISQVNVLEGVSVQGRRNNNRDLRRGDQGTDLHRSLSFLDNGKNDRNKSVVTNLVHLEVAPEETDYTRQFSFEKSTIKGSSRIYMRVSATLKRGTTKTVVEPRIVEIFHNSEVEEFLHCPEPPKIQLLSSSMSSASFLLRSSDPTLKNVRVVRVIKNPNSELPIIESRGIISFENSYTAHFEDSVDNIYPNVVTYRFIALNNDGSLGEFDSIVLTPEVKITDAKKADTAKAMISIRALNTRDYVDISVRILSPSVRTLRLLRQDLTSSGEFSSTVTNIQRTAQEYEVLIDRSETSITFQDRTAVSGRHYRYFAAYRLSEKPSSFLPFETISDEDEVFVRKIASDDQPFTTYISNPALLEGDNQQNTILFETGITETQEGFNTLFSALQSIGVSAQFLQDLQNDRQKIRQVAVYLVERVDTITGRRVSYGIFPPGKFEDSKKLRESLRIPDLIPGRTYEYIFKLCVRPPESFLLTALTGYTADSDKPGTTTKIIASKFQSSLSDRGVIPSERNSRFGSSVNENFISGQTGIEISRKFTLSKSDPKITNFSVKPKKNYNMITWSVSGNMQEVGYCLIYCNYMGRNELLGAISATGDSGTFRYKDDRFHSEPGSKNYSVKLMTNLNTPSVESKPIEVRVPSTMPLGVVSGYASGKLKDRNSHEVSQISFSPVTGFKNYLESNLSVPQEISAGWSPIYRNNDGSLVTNSQPSKQSPGDQISSQVVSLFNFGQVKKTESEKEKLSQLKIETYDKKELMSQGELIEDHKSRFKRER